MSIDFNNTEGRGYIEKARELLHEGAKVYIMTFGCQQNEADSERALGLAGAMGYIPTDKSDEADLILVNTCAIRAHAEAKALSMLGLFKAIKRKRPEVVIGILGCMVSKKDGIDRIKEDFHYVSFTLDAASIHLLPERVFRAISEGERGFSSPVPRPEIVEGMPVYRLNSHKAWVSIMYGCDNFCSYCIVPYVRGRERSRCSAEIVAECRSLVESGVKEITLLGQNVNSYASDIKFPELLRRVASIPGDFIIRFMTSHPKDVSDELISVMAELSPKIAPYFHLPLQSGSDRILSLMNRTYTKEHFISVAKRLKSQVPGIALSTDVIIGFPTEGEEDFLDTMDVLREVEFDFVYSFIYSKRVGTVAAKMEEQVPRELSDDRMARLLALGDEVSLKKNEEYVGRVERVLVDSVSKKDGYLSGRTDSGKLVHFPAPGELVGHFARVKIDKANPFNLMGELV